MVYKLFHFIHNNKIKQLSLWELPTTYNVRANKYYLATIGLFSGMLIMGISLLLL